MKSIKAQLVVNYGILLVLVLVFTAGVSIFLVDKDMKHLATETLESKLNGDVNALTITVENTYGKLQWDDGQLKKENGQKVRDDFQLVDEIGENLGVVVTIFQAQGKDFERISTNIVKDDGKRAIGTMLGKDSAAYNTILAKKRYQGEADILGKHYLTVYDPIVIDDEVVGILFVGVSTETVRTIIMRSLKAFSRTYALLILVVLAIAITLTIFIGSRLSKPLVAVTDASEALGNGNLSVALDKKLLDSKTEIGRLANSFEEMRLKLRTLIGDIQYISNNMLTSSESLNTISRRTSEVSLEVSKNVNEIAQGAMDQAENTENGTEDVATLGELIDTNSDILNETKSIVQEFSRLSEEGLETMSRLNKRTEESMIVNGEIAKSIESTQESSDKISAASDLILTIADQTNLLALNAAIEAARAGEMGRGFAVVAEEIRKLAEESKQSSEEIHKIIQELSENTKNAKNMAQNSSKTMEDQVAVVTENQEVFKEIYKVLTDLQDKFDHMEDSSQTMVIKRNRLLDVMQNLSAIAEENAAGSEEVSATVTEIIDAMNTTLSASEDLNKISKSLDEKSNQFII